MQPRVLAIASGGGHWSDLMRLYPVFAGYDVAFASVSAVYREQVDAHRFYVFADVSRLKRRPIVKLLPKLCFILLKERPSIVLTTGSAPALFTLALAKIFLRSKTIWIDCIGNAETLSLSGRLARHVADVWLTQWPHLQRSNGPTYWGTIL